MNTSTTETGRSLARHVAVTEDNLTVHLDDGRVLSAPVAWFPRLLHATPKDLAEPIRQGGGVGDWLRRAAQGAPVAKIEGEVSYPQGTMPLRYRLCFTMVGQKLELVDEVIENVQPYGPDQSVRVPMVPYY